MQNVWAMEYTGRGDKTVIGPVAGSDLAHSPCIRCGQCAAHCPTGAITTHNKLEEVFDKVSKKLNNIAVNCNYILQILI